MQCPYDSWIMSFDGKVHTCENCAYTQGEEECQKDLNTQDGQEENQRQIR